MTAAPALPSQAFGLVQGYPFRQGRLLAIVCSHLVCTIKLMAIIPLSQVSSQQLEEIFRQELSYWRNELFWDYTPAIRLIRKHISSKSLPGCAICNGAGALLGYGYYIISEPVAYIGNLYVRSESATSSAYAELVGAILEEFQQSTKIRRIEGQLFHFNCDLAPLFRAHRFTVINRYFLTRALGRNAIGRSPLWVLHLTSGSYPGANTSFFRRLLRSMTVTLTLQTSLFATTTNPTRAASVSCAILSRTLAVGSLVRTPATWP